ncbi:DUF928 domain-containing protein [Scytonema millei]
MPVRFNPPPPPPDRGAPGNRGEGASRGECISSNLPLTALVPSYEQSLSLQKGETSTMTQVWGLTSVEQPSFWFYLPYNQSLIQAIEFVLQTDNNKTIYRTNISIPPKSAIIGVSLKETPASLEIDKRYRWFLKVRVACNSQQTTLDYVEGWVQRVNLKTALSDRLKQATPQQQAVIYAQEGIWYDALTSLAELRLANPQDSVLAEDWKNLLATIGLEKVVAQPLVRVTR